MRRRKACIIVAIIVLLLCLLGPILAPYAFYTLPNYYRYRVNLAKWRGHSPSAQDLSYSAQVYVNQPDERLYGENFLEVRAGQLVAATNQDCADCQLAEFEPLSVNGLFALVRQRCIFSFPRSFCNLGYDGELGYPVRIDQYCGIEAAYCGPSITVGALTLSK
jgi:hypothetical protein